MEDDQRVECSHASSTETCLVYIGQRPSTLSVNLVKEVIQIANDFIRWVCHMIRLGSINIPCPSLSQVVIQRALRHLHNIISYHGEKFPAMERPSSSNIQIIRVRMRAYQEIVLRS